MSKHTFIAFAQICIRVLFTNHILGVGSELTRKVNLFLSLSISFLSYSLSIFVSHSKYITTIIIMSRYQHRYFWPSLATPPYSPLVPAVLQDYISNWHRVGVCRFELDLLPLLVHMKGSTGVHHLWTRPYFSSSVPQPWSTLKPVYIYI